MERETETRLLAILDEIKAERERQISKGFGSANDDRNTGGEISICAGMIMRGDKDLLDDFAPILDRHPWWPAQRFVHVMQKYAEDRRKQVLIAVAMGVAEIERLDRATSK